MKRKPAPASRPKWSDKALSVFGRWGRPIDPAKMVLKAQMGLAQLGVPTWRNDPTYNLRKKR